MPKTILFVALILNIFASQILPDEITKESSFSQINQSFIDSLNNPLSIKFESSQNLIFVQTRLNNSEPLWFILDSGASISVINEKNVRSLGLKSGDKNKINAIGGMVEYSLIKGVSIDVSGAMLSKQTIAAIDLSVLEPKLGRKIDGILGGEFFRRYVPEIDYAAHTIKLYPASKFKRADCGETIEIELENNTPFVRAAVSQNGAEFIQGKFLLDTGALSALYLNPSFIEKNNFLDSNQKTIPELFTSHLGGEIEGRIGRLQKIRLGNFEFENVVTHFFQPAKNEGSTSTTHDGIIGGDFFRRFTVTFDYNRQQMILKPNKNFAEEFETDASGLEIIAAGNDFKTIKIRKILENSPAAEAGLRTEDLITHIDNKPAAGFTLDEIEEMFSRKDLEYNLTVMRGREILQTKIKLKELIQ